MTQGEFQAKDYRRADVNWGKFGLTEGGGKKLSQFANEYLDMLEGLRLIKKYLSTGNVRGAGEQAHDLLERYANE